MVGVITSYSIHYTKLYDNRKRRTRIATRPGKGAIARRLDAKRKQGEKKQGRGKIED